MIKPGLSGNWVAKIAVAASAASFGLYVARTAAEVLYGRVPILLEGSAALDVAVAGALAVVALWILASFPRPTGRRGALSSAFAGVLLPLSALSAVFVRPFPDLFWSSEVLAAVGAGVLLAGVRARRQQRRCRHPLALTTGTPADSATDAGPWRRDAGQKGRTRWTRLLGGQVGPVLAGGVALAVYLRTMAPSVVAGDSAEFQTVGYTLGIAHPTGYPLFVLLAKAFTFLPFGTVAYRVNLVSGVFAAVAVYLLVHTAHALSGDAAASVVGGLTLAFGALFWSQAVVAEVYTLNAFFILLMIYLMVSSQTGPSKGVAGHRRLYALWFIFGLSLTHHRTAALLAPVLLVYTVVGHRRALIDPKAVLRTAGLTALPLLTYLYLPLRWVASNGAALDWEQFRRHVLASGYGFALRPEALWGEPARYSYFLNLLIEQLTIPGLILAGIGVLALLARRPRHALVTLLSCASFALFPIAYHVPDAAVFSMPFLIIFALWLGIGIAAVRSAADRVLRLRLHLAGGAELCFALGALVPGFLLAANYATNDASGDLALDRWGRAALEQEVRPGAIVVADMLRMSALRYFYGVEAPQRDVAVVMPDEEAVANKIIADNLNAGRPAYLARYLPGLESKYRLNAPGPLVEVTLGAPTKRSPAMPRQVTLPSGVTLLGLTRRSMDVPAGESWGGTLYWRAEQKLSDSYYVHLRLSDGTGAVAYAAKPDVPVQGLYPTWAWPSGEVIADYRELSLPSDLPAGSYELGVGLGGAFRAPAQWAVLGTLHVLPSPTALRTRPMLSVFDRSLALVGYDWGGTARPGGRVKVTLRWQSLVPQVEPGVRVHVDLIDSAGVAAATRDRALFPPGQARRDDGTWLEVEELHLPPSLAPGTYRLGVRLDSGDGHPWTALSGWPGREEEAATLTELTVTPPPSSALTNLENKAILVRRVLDGDELGPGDPLRLTLYWRAAAKLDLDYTVFVHLLDAAQRVRAQVDSFPAGGLRPTSQWRADELVGDAYRIAIPTDLPEGEYALEVGMYLAANMQRLQVLDAEERPVDDRVLIGTVRVRNK